ncbi:phage tail protein I [Pseudoalteromonas sp. JBTF-M23]|uniref:Phage tail protein I n=1 Tax=Pseudoalteromonas caenipelagi TaxID=2726988 RepID=A0A849V876_9GAMM|nr:phage tail protein I [Pseudoalteromonas caenipelagi]NOU49532.1 phage tail protein I [Pseudoalteromonas caenipelagi]
MSNTKQDFKSLLAPNASKFEQAHERATYFDDVKPIPDYVAKHWHPDTCPEKLLPWLAWSLSVDDWDEQWPVEAKRALIKNSVAIHKHKGTVGAVKRALKSLGVVIEFFEWFEDVDNTALIPVHSKEPNTFTFITWANEQVYTSQQVALSDALYKAINRVTNQTKPQRAHFNFLVGAKLDLGITVATTSSGLQVGRINYNTLPAKAAPSEITAGLTVSSHGRYAVNRQRGATKAVDARLQDTVALGVHLNNQRHTVGRFYMTSDQKLPAGCYYLQSQLAAGCHFSNRRISVGRFYLYPNK